MTVARCLVRVSGALGFAVALTATARTASADSTIVLDGTVDAGCLDHFFLPFTVPAGTAEIQIAHSEAPSGNILDWGLDDENGYRGWGGGLSDTLIVNGAAATRCYVPGPITPGTWNVVVGKAELVNLPVTYHVVITLRDAPTLAPQTERSPYQPIAPIETTRRWYAGDLHTHSTESGDAGDSIDVLVTYASSVGLDFVEISDHNSVTQMDYFNVEQAKHPNILLIPGEEWTTYHGHGNGIGATKWVDHKIGQPGVTVESSVKAFNDQGAIFSINHPAINLGTLCIGCAWTYYGLDPSLLGGVEIESRGYKEFGYVFSGAAIQLWEDLSASGAHLAALGGSDDHQGGQLLGALQTHISTPTTYVLADELSVAGILQGIKNRRTYVKLNSPADPAIDFESVVPPVADTVSARSTVFEATVTGTGGANAGAQLRWVKDGVLGDLVDITGDPFTARLEAVASPSGPDRVRAEVFVNGNPSAITSYLWLQYDAKGPDVVRDTEPGPTSPADAPSLAPGAPPSTSAAGCSARTGGDEASFGATGAFLGALAGLVVARRRRRRS